MQQEDKITKISVDLLIPNTYQPRKIFNDESLKELAASIKEYGILNPILVRKKDNLYEIIAGERRYRAAKLIGLNEVPVIIKEIPESKLAELALIENLQRENITPIEEAKSYQDILKLSSLKEEELSKIIGKSQSYISNKLRLLKLPSNIQDALINKKISERHARTLISINNPEKQTELLNRIINEKMTVKELEKIINKEQETNEEAITNEEIKSAIDDIMRSLNINTEIKNNEKEEKESDNMNNGNFFPNQQPPMSDPNMTLNNMNMQTLNQMPTLEAPTQAFMYNQPSGVQEQPIQGLNTTTMPTYETQPTMPEFNAPPLSAIEPQPQPEIVSPTPTIDPPLFDQNISNNSQPEQVIAPTPISPEPIYEVPVTTTSSLPELEPKNKLTELEKYLTTYSINYKKYSNDTGNCIIIEL